MSHFPNINTVGLFLEAEVAPTRQEYFEARYAAKTGQAIAPGTPAQYQNQPNKWGAELRIYFNDPNIAAILTGSGVHVEHPRRGYKSGEFSYRANDNELWWDLVESHGLFLGQN